MKTINGQAWNQLLWKKVDFFISLELFIIVFI